MPVSVTRATDDNCGGICGRLGSDAYIEHCTQNARLNSGDKAPDRGGIAGYQCGVVRYCVNLQSVDCNWDHVGGIAGTCHGGKIEYCRNEGKISGGDDTQWAGGICGKADLDSVIFGCYNSGTVFSDDDDDVGGILGERVDDSKAVSTATTGSAASWAGVYASTALTPAMLQATTIPEQSRAKPGGIWTGAGHSRGRPYRPAEATAAAKEPSGRARTPL